MVNLEPLLDSLDLKYFRSEDEYLLIFRGQALDYHVRLTADVGFLRAVCVLGRVPDSLEVDTARWLLEWNTCRSLARTGIGDDEFLILGDLPLEGLEAAGVEQLVIGVAAAAEEVSRELLPRLLAGPGSGASRASTGSRDAVPPGDAPDLRTRPGDGPEPLPEAEIDWSA